MRRIRVKVRKEARRGRRGKKERKEKGKRKKEKKTLHQTGKQIYLLLVVVMFCYLFIYLFIYRTIESLYEELAGEGIVMKCPKYHLSDYIGDFRYNSIKIALFIYTCTCTQSIAVYVIHILSPLVQLFGHYITSDAG